jgi:hypothetical protein
MINMHIRTNSNFKLKKRNSKIGKNGQQYLKSTVTRELNIMKQGEQRLKYLWIRVCIKIGPKLQMQDIRRIKVRSILRWASVGTI